MRNLFFVLIFSFTVGLSATPAWAEDPPKSQTPSGPASIVARMQTMESSMKEIQEIQEQILQNQEEIKKLIKQVKIWVRRN